MPRFSMRALLILVTCVAILTGWLSLEYKSVATQKDRIAKLQGQAHVSFYPDTQVHALRSFMGARRVEKVLEISSDEALQMLAGMDSVRSIYISGPITTKGLSSIKSRSLNTLHIESNSLDDDSLRVLKRFNLLQSLSVSSDSLSNEGLQIIGKTSSI